MVRQRDPRCRTVLAGAAPGCRLKMLYLYPPEAAQVTADKQLQAAC